MSECSICYGPCEADIHKATLNARAYLRAELKRMTKVVSTTNKKPTKIRPDKEHPVLKPRFTEAPVKRFYASGSRSQGEA